MVKYMIIHNKHEGCYDFQYFEDEKQKLRFTHIVINPPKIFVFDTREEANDFFSDYIMDIDVLDPKCKKGEEITHYDLCTCGIVDMDEDNNPTLFYNKRNQIFLMEVGCRVFVPNYITKTNISNMNYTNKMIRRCKNISEAQRNKYVELGNLCKECLDNLDTPLETVLNTVLKEEVNTHLKEDELTDDDDNSVINTDNIKVTKSSVKPSQQSSNTTTSIPIINIPINIPGFTFNSTPSFTSTHTADVSASSVSVPLPVEEAKKPTKVKKETKVKEPKEPKQAKAKKGKKDTPDEA